MKKLDTKGDFKDPYGDDAEAVMYVTATQNGKEKRRNQKAIHPVHGQKSA